MGDIMSVSRYHIGRRRILFSFFGVFMDERLGLAEQFRHRWPDVDVVEMKHPFRGLAVRFQESVYAPEEEELPESVSAGLREISTSFPDMRFVLLRTECWGGDCTNWGQFVRGGETVMNEPPTGPQNTGVLRRLLFNLDVDLGDSEIFEPLSRSFPWKADKCV